MLRTIQHDRRHALHGTDHKIGILCHEEVETRILHVSTNYLALPWLATASCALAISSGSPR